MKSHLTIIFIAFVQSIISQITISYQHNFDLYKPYTEEAQEYLKINDYVKSQTNEIQIKYRVIDKSKYQCYIGLAYKNIQHTVYNKIKEIPYDVFSSGAIVYSSTFYAPSDLVSVSHSMGLGIDNQFCLFKRKKTNGYVGFGIGLFFYENFKAKYRVDYSNAPTNGVYSEPSPMNDQDGGLMISSMNTSVFYLHSWNVSEKFRLGAKISLGTNLYSDWDQFQRYVWLGAGIELGFGKVKKG
jgi:uncharacterized protein YxeA